MHSRETPVEDTKARLRRELLTARRRRPAPQRPAIAKTLAEHLERELTPAPSGDVAAFLPLASEPPLETALQDIHRRGRRVWVPVVEPQHQLRWARWRPGVDLVPGSLPGLMEPAGPRHDLEIFQAVRLLVLPAVAVGADGVRLGFGGGYYDRFLTRLREFHEVPPMLVCVFHDEILPAGTVPREPHDAVMTRALTERGVVALGAADA